MKSSPITATSLLVALAACTPGLHPVVGVATPELQSGATASLRSTSHSPRLIPGGGVATDAAPVISEEEAADAVAGLFGPRVEAVERDASAGVAWDIDVSYADKDRVEHYVDRFTGSARAPFTKWLERGTRFEPMIRAKLLAADLPEDLYYLALVESGFDYHAYSRAAAVGMWQFMASTARAVGLRVDWWVDERRDPVKSTDAAIRYLASLKDQFGGSLYLAAAAYNGGSGRVSRGLAQHANALSGVEGDDRFFALAETGYLRAETREYVPQLIAAALVGKYPDRYGMDVEPLPPLTYDSVTVPGGTPLSAIATASGVSLEEVRDLNPQYLRGMTPLGEDAVVRVPTGRGLAFDLRFDELPEEERVAVIGRETTKTRGRLSVMAAAHGYTEKQLAWYNPGLRRASNGLLIGGQTVIIPSRGTLDGALDVADPSVERYGSTTRVAGKSAPTIHKVVSGESLSVIARRYKVTVAKLKQLNNLRSDRIRIGQKLVVKG